MRFQRITLLLVCAFAVFLGAVAALVIRQARGEDIESTLWVNALLVLLGLMMLTRVRFRPALLVPDRCAACGGRTFETARSNDRRHVRTCFSCGHEHVAEPSDAGPSAEAEGRGPRALEAPADPSPSPGR